MKITVNTHYSMHDSEIDVYNTNDNTDGLDAEYLESLNARFANVVSVEQTDKEIEICFDTGAYIIITL